MTPRTTERTWLEKTGGDANPPPWTDVIQLDLALRGNAGHLAEDLQELAADPPEEVTLLKRIPERWAKDWDVVDHRLSKAIERHSSLNEITPLLSKAVALEEGLINALLEAEDRGITKMIEDGSAETRWWLTDLRQEDLERAATLVQEANGNGANAEAKDSQSPSDLHDFEDAVSQLDDIATGGNGDRLTVGPDTFRAFLFALWVRGRATQFAEQRLLATLYRYPGDLFAVVKH